MNFKKKVGGSWTDTPHYIHNTSTDTITTLPADLYADGNSATVGLKGNMQQTGTPTPSNPVEVNGVGVRTENLIDESKVTSNTFISDIGVIGSSTASNLTDYIDINTSPFVISGVKTIDLLSPNVRAVCFFNSNKEFISGVTYNPDVMSSPALISDIPQNAKYVRFTFDKAFENGIMLNTGSTAKPYEPYGYKIPISSAGQTTPVYLGEVQTTRRIKKLVLTGEEVILRDREREGSWRFFTDRLISTEDSTAICTHFENIGTDGVNNSDNIGFSIFNKAQFGCRCPKSIAATASDFKAYLAAQYAAGTPVTVWYVLATEETGIVNEPLMKIGEYADTVSGITIPTIAGADSFDVLTTLKPSEVSLAYTGWHDATVKEWDGSQWS